MMIFSHHFGDILLTIALAIACVYVVWQIILKEMANGNK